MDSKFRVRAQGGYRKRKPNPDAFIFLPQSIVHTIGLRTHMGARIDAAVYSAFGYHYKKNFEMESEIRFSNGVKVRVPKGKFIVSINTIAEDLYYRWFLELPSGDDYTRFYEKVKKAVGRLRKKKLLNYHGYVDDRFKGTLGSVWSLEGTRLGSLILTCEQSKASGVIITRAVGPQKSEMGFVNTVDFIGGELMAENHRSFRYGEMCTSRFDRNRFTDYYNWIYSIANTGANGPRHTTAGAFRKMDLSRIGECPASIPFVVLDVDKDNPLDSHDSAVKIVSQLDARSIPLEPILVCYTGGRGFHICIPSGMFGNPVFSSSSKTVPILSRFVSDTFGTVSVDTGVFNPSHLVRCIGSKHEQSGLFKLAYRANEFLGKDCYSILSRSSSFSPFEVENPYDAKPVPELVSGFLDAVDRYGTYISPDFDEVEELDTDNMVSRTVARALQGVSEGEIWDAGRGYSGRNMAMFVVACHLLRKHDMDRQKAWNELQEVNLKNDPPLSQHELRGRLRSALNTLGARGPRRTWV